MSTKLGNFAPGNLLIPKERVIDRGMACHNCVHRQDAKNFWEARRQVHLTNALGLILEHRRREDDPKVVQIRTMVDKVDHGVASNNLIHCTEGKTAAGDPVGDLIPHSYLCEKWTGAVGASVARAGGKADTLPEELVDKLDGDQHARAADALVSDRFKVS